MNVLKTTGLTVHETMSGTVALREKMLRIYDEFFPEYSYYLPYMAYRMTLPVDADPGFIERWWLVELDEEPIALRLFKYSLKRNCAVVLGTAVRPEYRRYEIDGYDRLSAYLVNLSIEQVKADAHAAHRPVPAGLISEYQLPDETMSAEEYVYHQHIIERFQELGYIQLPVDYYEPPHIVGRESFLQGARYEQLPYNHMMLAVLPIDGGGFDIRNQQMVTDFTLACLTDHYKLPADHWVVRRALDSIDRHYRGSTND